MLDKLGGAFAPKSSSGPRHTLLGSWLWLYHLGVLLVCVALDRHGVPSKGGLDLKQVDKVACRSLVCEAASSKKDELSAKIARHAEKRPGIQMICSVVYKVHSFKPFINFPPAVCYFLKFYIALHFGY